MTINLDHFHHTTEIQVRWSDMDALGHVNNATYLTYFEQARIQYFNQIRSLWSGEANSVGLIMARVEIDYKMPLYADRITQVHTRILRLGNKSFTTQQCLTRTNDAGETEIVAIGMVTVVVYDYTAKHSIPIPEAWRVKIREIEPQVQES